MEKRTDRLKRQEKKFQESPDIVVKVVCKYRAELFFKISRKTKLSRLFNAWTDRMDLNSEEGKTGEVAIKKAPHVTFMFTHGGRVVESVHTPEEIGLEDSDEILAVEMLDLTYGETVRTGGNHFSNHLFQMTTGFNTRFTEAKDPKELE